MSDLEFNSPEQIKELEKLTDQELEDLVKRGDNLHVHMSKASVAKRLLENRRQLTMLKSAENVGLVAKRLEESNKGLSEIARGLSQIIKILDFFKTHWFPRQSILVRVGVFLLGTILLGILLNLIADAIAKFVLHW